MSPDTFALLLLILYVVVALLGALVEAFASEIKDERLLIWMLWPLLVVLGFISLPFLFASWLGRKWRGA